MLLLVLTAHFYFLAQGATKPVDHLLWEMSESGWIALDVFFVMSGFLITGILLDTKGAPHFFKNFYARRFLRIFPIYYVTLFAVFIILPRLQVIPPSAIGPVVDVQAWYWSYLTNVLVATTEPPAGSIALYTRHLWSLAVEEQFYLLWPLVVFLCGPRRLIQICAAMVLGAAVFRAWGVWVELNPRALYVLTPARMDGLALGSMMAVIARQPGGLALLTRWSRPVVAVALLMGLAVFVYTGRFSAYRPPMQFIGYTLVALGASGLVIMAATTPPATHVGRFFHNRVLIALGTFSYATYVTHTFVFLVIQRQFRLSDRLPTIMGYGWPASVVYTVFLGGVSIFVGFLSWHLMEKHFLKLKVYFAYERPRPPAVPPSAPTLEPVQVSPPERIILVQP